jgi:hypothetical protein
MSNLSVDRAVINSLLPEGPIWEAETDEGFDQYLNAKAQNSERVANFTDCLAFIRDPFKTCILSDLEKEYGILTNINLTEQQRRDSLATKVYPNQETGSEDNLQNALRSAGFDVYVHQNDPAVDPAIFLAGEFFMVAGGDNAYAGRSDAFAGKGGGDLLVNGEIFEQSPSYFAQANGDNMFAGNSQAFSGGFSELRRDEIIYPLPTDPDDWPFVFFVGGEATRDPITGELLTIATAEVPIEREQEFDRIILQRKGLYTWCGLLVDFV